MIAVEEITKSTGQAAWWATHGRRVRARYRTSRVLNAPAKSFPVYWPA